MSGYLLDTHVLLWAGAGSDRLPARTRALLEEPSVEVRFSVVNLWETVIKQELGRPDFRVDASAVRAYARLVGLAELPVQAEHVLAVRDLPPLHADPFDRLLVAQARHEGLTLLTVDPQVRAYADGVEHA